MPTTPSTADRSTARRGFTLTELMVVTTLIGVMAAMSVPSFQRAMEQSRADIAVANLRAIWAAERLYWLEPATYTDAYPQVKNRYTADLTVLSSLDVIDPEIVVAMNADGSYKQYSYTVTYDPANPTSFTAMAARKDSNGATLGSFIIDQTGHVYSLDQSGQVVDPFITIGSGSSSFTITPGFQ